MKLPPPRFPDLEALTAGLNAVLADHGVAGERVTIFERSAAIYATTYPSEIVTCRVGNRNELRLYCKYMAGINDDSHGHRGGVPYEAEIYRRVLQPLSFSVPKFYGAYVDPATADTWLVLEYMDQSLRVTKGPQPESILLSARWIGGFHVANETRIPTTTLSFLKRYDSDYYLGWVRRTSLFASSLQQCFPWLATLSARFQECIDILFSSPQTLIHGEFYPHNVLLGGGVVYPIDWESAAIGPGEIDLATLTEDWGPETVRQCELEYQRARWGGPTSADFGRRLAAARLYVCFRWLGDQPEWTLGNGNRVYFERMRSLGEELGLI